MATDDSITNKLLNEQLQVTENLKAIRSIGDLLCMAADSEGQGRNEFSEDTLAEIGSHINALATEGLVIIGYEGPKGEPEPEPQAAPPDQLQPPAGYDQNSTKLTPENLDAIMQKMAKLKTQISVFVAASTGRDEFDYEGFAMTMEDQFAELYDTYQEAIGGKWRYQRCSTR
ncbi:MAG: hypothetical protein WC600_03335 [Desulfobaccales bacterium]